MLSLEGERCRVPLEFITFSVLPFWLRSNTTPFFSTLMIPYIPILLKMILLFTFIIAAQKLMIVTTGELSSSCFHYHFHTMLITFFISAVAIALPPLYVSLTIYHLIMGTKPMLHLDLCIYVFASCTTYNKDSICYGFMTDKLFYPNLAYFNQIIQAPPIYILVSLSFLPSLSEGILSMVKQLAY